MLSTAIIFIWPALSGFQSEVGEVYKNVFLKHGARGPLSLPGIQVLFSPHHPQPELRVHPWGLTVYTLHSTWMADRFSDPL